jgi:hypothetical protein
MFKGYKTYARRARHRADRVGGYLHGDLTVLAAVTTALSGLGLAGLRNAI